MHYRTKVSKTLVPLMIGARTFMRAARKGTIFAIYAILVAELIHRINGLPMQYEEYQDVFEKKNADILWEHIILSFRKLIEN